MVRIRVAALLAYPLTSALVQKPHAPTFTLAQRDVEESDLVSNARQLVETSEQLYKVAIEEESNNIQKQESEADLSAQDITGLDDQVQARALWQHATDLAWQDMEASRSRYAAMVLNSVRKTVGKAAVAFRNALEEEQQSIKEQDVMYERHLDVNDTEWYVEQGQMRETWQAKTEAAKNVLATARAHESALSDAMAMVIAMSKAHDEARFEEAQGIKEQQAVLKRYLIAQESSKVTSPEEKDQVWVTPADLLALAHTSETDANKDSPTQRERWQGALELEEARQRRRQAKTAEALVKLQDARDGEAAMTRLIERAAARAAMGSA